MQVTVPGFTGHFEIATYHRRGWFPRFVTIVTQRTMSTCSTYVDVEGEHVLTIPGSNHRRAQRHLLDRIRTTTDLDHLRDRTRPPNPYGLPATWKCPACGHWEYGELDFPLGDGVCPRHPTQALVKETVVADYRWREADDDVPARALAWWRGMLSMRGRCVWLWNQHR